MHAGARAISRRRCRRNQRPTESRCSKIRSQQPAIAIADPALPERADYFDVGVDQQLSRGLGVGIDAYYKRATDLLDDGQFGQANVLRAVQSRPRQQHGDRIEAQLRARGAARLCERLHAITKALGLVSNQYLFMNPAEFTYLSSHDAPTRDAQTVSASTGVSYRLRGLLASVDGIYGSGLPTGFANLEHLPGYTQWNAAVGWRFDSWSSPKSLTVRLSAINIFDRSYVLREASGIGEFAPQYGPRRGLFAELTQQL